MLGLLGAVVAEGQTGISWVDAGKVLNEQPSYLGFDINVPVTTLVWIEVLAMGFAEVKRSAGACPNRRYRPAPPAGSPLTTQFSVACLVKTPSCVVQERLPCRDAVQNTSFASMPLHHSRRGFGHGIGCFPKP